MELKKYFLFSFLALIAATGVFAQFKFGLYADFFPELLRLTAPGGDYADINNDIYNLYKGTGTVDILSSSSIGRLGKQSELRAELGFSGKGYSFYVQIAFDDYLQAATGSGWLVDGDELINANYATILNQVFNEWYLWGSAGMFTAFVGSTDDYGKTARFEDSFDDFIDAIRIKDYGVILPNGPVSSNNLLPQIKGSDTYGLFFQPYFSISVNPQPFTFQVAGDIGSGSGISPANPDPANPERRSYTRLNGALRFSGERIARRVSFDAIYRFRGGNPNTDPADPADPTKAAELPDGSGITIHSMGLYANIIGIPSFGIGFGYSGLFRLYDKMDSSYNEWESRTTPFFSGVDLRVQYSGIGKLTISSHNNISFAATKGSDDSRKEIMPVEGGAALPLDTGESWLALYNALSFNYKLSSQLLAALQLGNRLESLTVNSNGSKELAAHNRFAAAVFTVYRFNANITVHGGLQLLVDSEKYKDKTTLIDVNGSMAYFAIPLRFKVIF
jgi:hypothetical protein